MLGLKLIYVSKGATGHISWESIHVNDCLGIYPDRRRFQNQEFNENKVSYYKQRLTDIML